MIRTLDPHVPNGVCFAKPQHFRGRRFHYVLACSSFVQSTGPQSVRNEDFQVAVFKTVPELVKIKGKWTGKLSEPKEEKA